MAPDVHIPADTAAAFTAAFSETGTAYDVAASLTCIELDAFADLLEALGAADAAATWRTAHEDADNHDDAPHATA